MPARKFSKYRAAGVGAKITAIQDTNADAHMHVIEGTEVNEGVNQRTRYSSSSSWNICAALSRQVVSCLTDEVR